MVSGSCHNNLDVQKRKRCATCQSCVFGAAQNKMQVFSKFAEVFYAVFIFDRLPLQDRSALNRSTPPRGKHISVWLVPWGKKVCLCTCEYVFTYVCEHVFGIWWLGIVQAFLNQALVPPWGNMKGKRSPVWFTQPSAYNTIRGSFVVFGVYIDKPARLTIVPDCQIRQDKVNYAVLKRKICLRVKRCYRR